MTMPSSPQDFKKKRKVGELLTLPSGLTIKVRSVDLVSLVVSGKVPNALLTTIQSHLSPLEGDTTLDDATKIAESMSPEELSETFSLMDTLVIAMAMEPEVHKVPENENERDENLLYVDELGSEDKLFMFKWSQEGLESANRFPKGPETNLVPMEEVGSIEPEASTDPRVSVE